MLERPSTSPVNGQGIGRSLVTRFHFLLFGVVLAITATGLFRIPQSSEIVALWGPHSEPLWVWPRNMALAVAPPVAALLIAGIALWSWRLSAYGREMVRHNLDPALAVLLSVVAAVQLGIVLAGTGSDIDFIRILAFILAPALLVFGIVFAEAERNTYAGLRLPWPIEDDALWRVTHRVTGWLFALGGVVLGAIAWVNPDMGNIILALPAVLLLPPAIAAAMSVGR